METRLAIELPIGAPWRILGGGWENSNCDAELI